MATTYDAIEDGIKAVLNADGTPFKTVVTYGAQLSDGEIADELAKLVSTAPAALVFYGGGETNKGFGGDLLEEAVFTILVIAAARSRTASLRGDAQSVGVYELLDYCRGNLHNVPGIEGIPNPLIWIGNRRFSLPGDRLTVAAYMCNFTAPVHYPDGPT